MNRRTLSLVIVILLTLLTLGCLEGDQQGPIGEEGPAGEAGPIGPAGPTGPPASVNPVTLNVTITDVRVNSAPEVDFQVLDQSGAALMNLSLSDVRFTFAKLVPSQNGDASYWQSYINQKETAEADPEWPGEGEAIQATYERNVGTLEDHGNGTYTYTFATDVTNVTTPTYPLEVVYEDYLTHRVGMQLSGPGLPVANATYDFRPDGGMASTSRDIVTTDSCNECHGQLALHGGGRIDTKFCVTCHNPGTTDAQSENTVDFKVMVHKIHMGRDLPRLDPDDGEPGAFYAIWGHNDNDHDYSELGYPQDQRYCTKCHDGSAGAEHKTADGNNWKTVPTIEACGSCHDNVVFDAEYAGFTPSYPNEMVHTGNESAGPQTDNSECLNCHDTHRPKAVATVHKIPAIEAAKEFQYNIEDVDTASLPDVTVTFSVTNPDTGDHYDVRGSGVGDPEFNAGFRSRLAVLIGWDTLDYYNEDSGSHPAMPVSIDAIAGATLTGGTSCPTDCTFEVTTTLPTVAQNSGTGVVAIEGHPAADPDGDSTYDVTVPVQSAVEYFAIQDVTPVLRRQVVDITAKCDNCHGTLAMHGANRVDEGQVCVICHNPNATDVDKRPADPATTADGKIEESIDFKRMIHAIHAAGKRQNPYVVWGYGNNEHVFDESEVHFPGILNDCTQCHVERAYELPLYEEVWATTVVTAPSAATAAEARTTYAAELADPSDDLNFSRTAAVCSACHDDAVAGAHMQQNGAAMQLWDATGTPTSTSTLATQSDIDAGSPFESCVTCHGSGKIADVSVVHGID